MPAKPKWERIADEIRTQIESGELAPGAQLPSTAQLRAKYDVSAGVVRQAILVLQTKGLVEGVHGLGVFVTERSSS
ncbi:GntR family transcriptional regulator [Plantactinospora sp. CA-290183]|uniref:GntR family transcriptional regulator n=1 Tax=Plantactinospora sp. CA-290183 TaxID=3240006 RepID=UPI003D94EA4C